MKHITNIPGLPGNGEDYGILGAILTLRENAEKRILFLLINALDYALSDDCEHQEHKWTTWNHPNFRNGNPKTTCFKAF